MLENGSNVRALMEALEEPALIVQGGIVRLANTAALNLLGSAIEGRDVRLAIRHPQALDRILRGAAGDVDVVGIGDVGRPWRLIIRQLDRGRAFIRMVDRSDALSSERMRVDFVANASHELRTPLATIIGYAETLADDSDLPGNVRTDFGRTIRDEGRRMLRIIEDLMSLSRIQADRFATPIDPVSIDDVVSTAVSNVRLLAERRQCEITTEIAANLPPVKGDFPQLVQVLDNVLANAVRYGCAATPCSVKIAAIREGKSVRITVADKGPGIARENLPRLTERFFRVDEARSRNSGGTGLGLSIVKHILERHRGTLEITSEPGVGTIVSIQLRAVD